MYSYLAQICFLSQVTHGHGHIGFKAKLNRYGFDFFLLKLL